MVLVGVLKSKRDLEILLKERWYRIPMRYAPVRQFDYLAFYEPARFGRQGKRINYYASVAGRQRLSRSHLLPEERGHPRAQEKYLRVRLGRINKLPKVIRNSAPRRIIFGFTTLGRLRTSRDILQLYNIPPTEEIIRKALRRARLKAQAQYYVSVGGRRYCLDFTIFCKQGDIAVECDNLKAHSRPSQKEKDKAKDQNLKNQGWRVIRLTEPEILGSPEVCIKKIRREVKALGGTMKG